LTTIAGKLDTVDVDRVLGSALTVKKTAIAVDTLLPRGQHT